MIQSPDHSVSAITTEKNVLFKMHEGHSGITTCREGVKQSVWPLDINKELKKGKEDCNKCAFCRTNFRKTLLSTEPPTEPWCAVEACLFPLGNQHHLLVVDHFCRYYEKAKFAF